VKENKKEYIEWFRHSAPYINKHRGKTFVLCLSGEAVRDENFIHLVHDINLLNSLGIRLVLVHGARPQIEEALQKENLASKFHKNLRISSLENLPAICQASTTVRTQIEALFSMGISNSPMHGSAIKLSSGNYVNAKPLGVVEGVDLEHTGEVRSINSEAINELLCAGHIVLLSNIAYSPTGEVFNLSSEEVACECAIELEADKLIYFSEHDGCQSQDGKLLRELGIQFDAAKLATEQQAVFRTCTRAISAGLERAHIVSHAINGALIEELFTRDGSGTLISSNAYENLRQAGIEDVNGIIELIAPLEEQGVLVKRSRDILENEIDRFTVLERDGHIIACAALYLYGEAPTAELACICVDENYQDADRGEKLLAFVEQQARFLNIEKLFVLTTQTAHWFLERGFEKASLEDLPLEKQSLYNYQRNSLIFIKALF
jgi:amino-acid N-acetyltransferase